MLSEDKLTSRHVKWILASFFTWTFDLYDLFIILLVTPYISSLFFPSQVPLLSIAATYAGFLVSFIMRPFGAGYFGTKIADKVGRKRAIIYGIIGLVITTSLQGALPTFYTAGILAPTLLILLRLIQGFFIGGVTAGSHTIGPESVPERHRGWVGGIGFAAAGAAYLIASLWFYATTIWFPGNSYLDLGWRVMFFSGLFPLIILFYVSYITPESEVWSKVKQRGQLVKSPLREIFKNIELRRKFFIALIVTVGWALMYYLTQGLFPTFLSNVNSLPRPSVGIVMIFASLGMLIGPVIGGALSQLIGRKTMSLIGSIIVIIMSPLFLILGGLTINELNLIILLAFTISFIADFGGGIVMTYLNETYPTQVRGTGVALTWNIGFAIGGSSPTIVTLILNAVGGFPKFPLVMTVAIIVAGIIELIGTLLSPETKGAISKEKALMGE
ncbi:MAG: MFS transporter [Sulfolobaceae archaeon]